MVSVRNRNVKDITTKLLKQIYGIIFPTPKLEVLNWYHQIVRLMELSTTFLNFRKLPIKIKKMRKPLLLLDFFVINSNQRSGNYC